VTLLHPVWLLLALAVPIIWFWPRPLRDRRLGLLRSVVLLLLALGAARPVVFDADAGAWYVAVLDGTMSALPEDADEARRQAQDLAERLPADAHRVLLTLGHHVATGAFERSVALHTTAGGSDLGAALEAAGRALPAGARGSVTLWSDGRSTARSWARATEALTQRGIPVHTIALNARRPSAAVVGLDLPEILRVGATARVGVRLTGHDTVVRVRLRTKDGRDLALRENVALDGPRVVPLSFEPREAGFLDLEAALEVTQGADTTAKDDAARVVAAVQEPLRVLYLGERMVEGGPHLAGLLGRGFVFDVASDAAMMDDAGWRARIARSDLVLLDDRPAETVPAAAQRAILAAVENGTTGLVMTGGRASFGAGGWQRSPLAAALPVELVQKEEKRDPSTTLVVIIDTSGSMGGNRVQLAKEVTRLAIRRLLPHDKVGIVEFYGAKRWAAPIQPASNAIEIQRALNRLNAGGGTVIMPAIEEAFYGLQNVNTRYKHVLVLTDGGVETGAFEPLLRRMAEKGITVSTVLIGGSTHSEFLVNLANWGKGRYYGVPNRFNLPEILLKQPASAHLPAWRPGQHALTAKGGAGWWGTITTDAIPPLAGYVETRARPGATTLLEVTATKHPVLATWRHGLGRVTTLMTEPTGPGTAGWRSWSDEGALLARVFARTASDARPPYVFDLVREEGEAILRAVSLRPDAAPPVAERIAGVDDQRTPLTFRRRAPDLFEARFAAPGPAAVRVEARAPNEVPFRLAAMPAWTPEDRPDLRKALDLDALATATGGRALALADAAGFVPTVGGGSEPVAVRVLWPWCLLLALLVWLVELYVRRRPRQGGTA